MTNQVKRKPQVSINVCLTKQARRQALRPLSNPLSSVVCKVFKSDKPVSKQALFRNSQRVK